jgi:hypothetical protein
MKKSFFLLVLSFFFIIVAKTQTPDWALETTRKFHFPEGEFLIGFQSEKNVNKENPQDLLNRIEGYAKEQLIEYIQVKVKGEATQEMSEVNGKVQSRFVSIYSSSSNLEVTGLKIEKSYDPKTKMGYAIAYARKADLAGYYKGIIDAGLTNAAQKIEEAKNALNSKDIQRSIKVCFEAGNILPSIEQAQRVIIAIKSGNLSESDIQNERAAKQRTSIDDIVREAQRSSNNTVDEASFFIARGLKLQTGKLEMPVMLMNFTYEDTKMGSDLSRRLNQYLSSKLVSEAGYVIGAENTDEFFGYVLNGTYWKEVNEIKVISTLKDNIGKIVATAEAFVPLTWFQSTGVNYLPENFDEAYSKMKALDRNEIVKGDLNVEVWTNKGRENLIFSENDLLKFYVKANKECYLTFIYHLADGNSVLLFDNYRITEDMVNKTVEIPYDFECAEPFGVETLQVNAQTIQFPKIETISKDGYYYITGNLNEVLSNTRGFKNKSDKDIQRAEKRLMFTTMKK